MKPILLLGIRYTLENSGHLPTSSNLSLFLPGLT